MGVRTPRPVESFKHKYAAVWEAFEELASRSHAAGPLDEKNRRILKLGLAIGAGLEGGLHSAVRHAVDSGITPEEIRHCAVLAISTLGFPASMRALTWIEDCLSLPDQQPHAEELGRAATPGPKLGVK